MILLNDFEFRLPLTNPVIVFSLVLFIILFAPILLNKLKIPHIIGLIVAGVIIGPYGLNLLSRDSSIVLFGTVGLLYIMFIAGLEIDLDEFKKNKKKILVFGLTTFILPLVFGALSSYYILGFGITSSVLLASMFSTHTLVSYPIASRYGIARNKAVTLAVGGTMITDILALVILAVIAGMAKGAVTSTFWIKLGVSSVIFVGIVFFVFPFIIRWFFKTFDDNVSQYIFVLAMVFLAAFLAEAAGVEAIIGAFFSGLVLNKFIPHSSPLMNRIDFVGNALFIPFFLISVGMLVDMSILVKGFGALKVAGIMIFVAIVTKYLAAWITQKFFGLAVDERKVLFGLSTSHAAATLAIILVGYNIIIGETALGEPVRLFNEDVLNGTILLILVSCGVSSFVVEKAARNLAMQEGSAADIADEEKSESILVSLAYAETVPSLMELGLIMQSSKSYMPFYTLHVVSEHDALSDSHQAGKKMIENAIRHAASTDKKVIPLTRHDMNISNGIIYTIKEHNISDLILGLHKGKSESNFELGPVVEKIIKRISETIFVYKARQPLNTLKRIVVVVPVNAEYEPGFHHWFERLYSIAKETALPLRIYGENNSLKRIAILNEQKKPNISISYQQFANWDEFLVFTRELKEDDLFVIVTSRRGHLSYHPDHEKIPSYLLKHFAQNSFILLYPRQMDYGPNLETQHMDNTLMSPLHENLEVFNKAGDYVKKIFTGSGGKTEDKE